MELSGLEREFLSRLAVEPLGQPAAVRSQPSCAVGRGQACHRRVCANRRHLVRNHRRGIGGGSGSTQRRAVYLIGTSCRFFSVA
jgi:hypothetical protein